MAGHGQVVAVVGEAGVGKSRLVYECLHAPQTQGWRILESASVSYGKATPYFPVIDLLKRYAHVEEHDDPRTVRAKVTGQILTLDETLQDNLPALLSLRVPLSTRNYAEVKQTFSTRWNGLRVTPRFGYTSFSNINRIRIAG